MAGTTVAVGVLAVAAILAAGVGTAGAAAVRAAQASATADTAALAAADTVLGHFDGAPCDRAGRTAVRAGLELTACEVDGVVATVEVAASMGVFRVQARARAGPAR
ncbi:MAG: helicase [Microbacterium arborescens]